MSTPAPVAKASGFLRRKVLGVPLLYPLALIVLLLAVYAYKTMHTPTVDNPTTNPVTGDLGATTDSEADNSVTGDAVPTLSSGTVYGTSAPIATPDPTTLDDNDAWTKRGVAWGQQNGIGATATQTALQEYLNGSSLSYDEGAIVEKVIAQFGPPPTLPSSTSVAPKPAQRQGTPPTTHTVQGPNDNQWGSLSQLYYGRLDADHIDLLQGANGNIGNSPFPVGTKVNIPAYHAPVYFTATPTVRTLPAIAAKNAQTQQGIIFLNNGKLTFPVAVGTRVRVH